MIYMITGQPGHGKTLRGMELAVNFLKAGRTVYANGIRGLKYGEAGFNELPDPKDWASLPDGAVILLDECYGVFPRRMPGAKVPPHVELLATHRHRGFDFILICQQAKQQLDTFLLGLVERHEHIRRKWGFKKSIILWWDKFSENVTNSLTKKVWTFPTEIMKRNLYESTVQDTTQMKIPWFIWAIPVVLVSLITLVWYIKHSATQEYEDSKKPFASALLGGGGQTAKRPDDLVKYFTPRLPGAPWSAPAYDQRPVVVDPELYCIAMEDGRCDCITEQGTKYAVPEKLCRTIVRDGSYNPTRKPHQERENASQSEAQKQERPQAPQSSQQGLSEQGGDKGNYPSGVGQPAYIPPQQQQPLSAEPGYVHGS
jgi:zona occludens toxin